MSNNTKERALKLINYMYVRDRLAQHFEMKLIDGDEGFSKLTMRIRPEMLNGHNICHGGVTFALADTAFAYACNSRNRKTVALNCLISFAQVVNEGDELTALAKEEICNNRTGTYDVTITNQTGNVVALFRGTSYATKYDVVTESNLMQESS